MSTIAEAVKRMEEHNRQFFQLSPGKVVVQRAGSHRKVRYEGSPIAVFIDGDASVSFGARKLKFFCNNQGAL